MRFKGFRRLLIQRPSLSKCVPRSGSLESATKTRLSKTLMKPWVGLSSLQT